jgi:hypothetical protein
MRLSSFGLFQASAVEWHSGLLALSYLWKKWTFVTKGATHRIVTNNKIETFLIRKNIKKLFHIWKLTTFRMMRRKKCNGGKVKAALWGWMGPIQLTARSSPARFTSCCIPVSDAIFITSFGTFRNFPVKHQPISYGNIHKIIMSKHGRMERGGNGLPKVSQGPAMLYSSTPCGEGHPWNNLTAASWVARPQSK